MPNDYSKNVQIHDAAVVYTLCLPKASVSGATRWFRSNPLIQFTDRHETNDHFWFPSTNEAAYVLTHPKKKYFSKEFEGYKPDQQKEDEADSFATRRRGPDCLEDR